MKRKFFMFLTAILSIVLLSLTVVACGDKSSNGSDGDPTNYLPTWLTSTTFETLAQFNLALTDLGYECDSYSYDDVPDSELLGVSYAELDNATRGEFVSFSIYDSAQTALAETFYGELDDYIADSLNYAHGSTTKIDEFGWTGAYETDLVNGRIYIEAVKGNIAIMIVQYHNGYTTTADGVRYCLRATGDGYSALGTYYDTETDSNVWVSGDIQLESTINSLPLLNICSFESCTDLTSIIIPDSVLYLPFKSFYQCTNLENVTMSANVIIIGEIAFSGCTSLESITLPDTLEDINYNAFKNCASLTSIVIPLSVTSIDDNAFAGCTNLTINCKVATKPNGWSDDWNIDNCTVVWNYSNDASTTASH